MSLATSEANLSSREPRDFPKRRDQACFPLEDARARQAYGVPSGVNNLLVINNAVVPARITAILVNEPLGF